MSNFGLNIAAPGPRYFKAEGEGTKDDPNVIGVTSYDYSGGLEISRGNIEKWAVQQKKGYKFKAIKYAGN